MKLLKHKIPEGYLRTERIGLELKIFYPDKIITLKFKREQDCKKSNYKLNRKEIENGNVY